MDNNRVAQPAAFGRIDVVHAFAVLALVGVLVWVTVLGGWRFGPIRELLVSVPASDKIGHALIYGTITFFAALVAKRPARIRGVAWVVLAVGVIDEFRQLGEMGRAFTVGDLIANAVGVVVGVAVAMAILHRRSRSAPSLASQDQSPKALTSANQAT